jgi:hypothetical protein
VFDNIYYKLDEVYQELNMKYFENVINDLKEDNGEKNKAKNILEKTNLGIISPPVQPSLYER